jgi:hypothetical protein
MRGISSFKLQRRRENEEVMRRERWRGECSEMDGNERMREDIEARMAEKKWKVLLYSSTSASDPEGLIALCY